MINLMQALIFYAPQLPSLGALSAEYKYLRPVAISGHPLPMLGRLATRADLKPYVQLILSDQVSPDGPSYGVTGSQQWRLFDAAPAFLALRVRLVSNAGALDRGSPGFRTAPAA